MKKKVRAEKIKVWLEEYFPNPVIPLKHSDPFTLLLAVLLSAQCTDERVNKITPKLFSEAKTPLEMSQLSIEKIAAIIRPCGLSNVKAKAIQTLSKILVDSYCSKVPTTLCELESLPGVGHKTASVVLVQAFQIPAFPVDTHIHRLAKRWELSSGKNVVQTEKDLKRLYPKKLWGKLHLQMIYYARRYCPARGHNILHCPICHDLHLLDLKTAPF